MRTTTSTELALLASLDRQDLVRLKIADHLGAMQDRTAWFDSATIRQSVDQLCTTADVVLGRETDIESIAPMVNANDPVAENRAITIEVAVIGQSDTVTEDDWVPLFDGTIKTPSWGGRDSTMTLSCRDRAAVLMDTWIETPATYGNDGSPEDVEAVIQELLDDTLGEGEVTLITVGNPDLGIVEYTQSRQRLADAVQANADLQGWDLRYRYLTAESPPDWYLVYQEPNRDNETPAHTFGPDDYYDVTDIQRTTDGVRNVIEVEYAEGSSVTIENTTSITELGGQRKFLYVDAKNDPQIRNSATATVLAEAIAADLGQATATQTVDAAFFWPAELHDLYTWEANGKHYTTDQDMAVTAIEHRLSRDGNSTVFSVRGKPSGGAQRWLRREKREITRKVVEAGLPPEVTDPDRTATVQGPTIGFGDDGAVIVSALGNGYARGIIATASTGTPSDITLGDSTTTTAAVAIGDASIAVASTTGLGGSRWYVLAGGGEAELVRVQNAGVSPITLTAGYRPLRAYPIGSTIREVDLADTVAYGLLDGVWTATLDGGTVYPTLEPDFGALVTVKYRAINTSGALGPQVSLARRRGDGLDSAARPFGSTVVFSSAAQTTVSWTSGTVTVAEGTPYSISSGSLTSMSTGGGRPVYYIYLDPNVSTTVLQTTSTAANAVGGSRVMLCIARAAPTSGQNAMFVPGVGTLGLNADNLSVNSVSADTVQANAITAGKISVTNLAAINVDAGTITAGVLQNAAGTRFVDLGASGTDPFIKHDNFQLLANGSATFSGTVAASVFTAPTAAFNNLQISGGSDIQFTGFVSDVGVDDKGAVGPHTGDDLGVALFGGGDVTFESGSSTGHRFVCATDDMTVVDAGTASATESGWIEVDIGGTTAYLRAYASK